MKTITFLHRKQIVVGFLVLGEASTTKIARSKNVQGFTENKDVARKGGKIAGDAREKLELESGERVAAPENYLEEPELQKRKRLRAK